MTGTDDRAADEIGPAADRTAPTGALLTVAEVSQLLRVNIRTVRRMIDRGELSCVRIGRQYRVEQPVFDAFIVARRYRPSLLPSKK